MTQRFRAIVAAFALAIIVTMVAALIKNTWAIIGLLVAAVLGYVLFEPSFASIRKRTATCIKANARAMREWLADLARPARATFSRVFDFEGEPVCMVYTCRSRIDGFACPHALASGQDGLLRVVALHLAIDEFRTAHLLLRWYGDQLLQEGHAQLPLRMVCSSPLDSARILDGSSTKPLRARLPDFMFENLIIIGENSCSTLILEYMKQVLNFCGDIRSVTITPGYPPPRDTGAGGITATALPWINLRFLPNHGNSVRDSDRVHMNTNFEQGSSAAVAMVCYAPNPFNVQKDVLILYGCHRVGQYLLEQWLHGRGGAALCRELFRGRRATGHPVWGQIALYSHFVKKGLEHYDFTAIRTMKNSATGKSFFPFSISTGRLERDGFKKDRGALQQTPMVDISLVVELKKRNEELCARIVEWLRKELPFLQGNFWEADCADVGLHITLHEFATHESHASLPQGVEELKRIEEVLRGGLHGLGRIEACLTGCEVFPASVVIFVDVPTEFLEAVRAVGLQARNDGGYLNRFRVPFPLHCTVIRFTEQLSQSEQQQLRQFAAAHRRHVFGRVLVEQLSLLLTCKRPYQDVHARRELSLC